MKLTTTFAEFKALVARSTLGCEWEKIHAGLFRGITSSGVTINYYPKARSISFKGDAAEIARAKEILFAAGQVNAEENVVGRNLSEINVTYKKTDTSIEIPEYRSDFDSELVIGLVGAVGTDLSIINSIIRERLSTFDYACDLIKISDDIIQPIVDFKADSYCARVNTLMTEGNELRKKTGDYGFLAKAAAARINAGRGRDELSGGKKPSRRKAHIISSLKHPDEVAALRKIYSSGFFLIGVYGLESRRLEYLVREKGLTLEEAKALVERDANEIDKHGQHTRDTYHLSDFFVDYGSNIDKFKKDIWRFVDLIFGRPFVTPTFDEYAMFMAFSASLRSADLSRQVGAVVTKERAIVSTGANDVPQFGGGLYWPEYGDGDEILDKKEGRDYIREGDTNVLAKNEIIKDILSRVDEPQRDALKAVLAGSKLKDITEYGRIVHAEMEALLSCARGHISTKDTHLYCTTFPCHNCAKHIVAAGVKRVVYVEPYPKSKALDFHEDSITLNSEEINKVRFEPFVGVGPRSFFNLFSVNLGSGYSVSRKTDDGKPATWNSKTARLRLQMLPTSYIEREIATTFDVGQRLENLK